MKSPCCQPKGWSQLLTLVATVWLSGFAAHGPAADRVPWTQSALKGSPEPPLPYVLERAYPIEFVGPVSINRMPESSVMLVCEQEGRIYAFDSADASPASQLVIDMNQSPPPQAGIADGSNRRIQLFSLTFDPDFSSNRYVYICYVTTGGPEPTVTHISRFTLSEGSQVQVDVASEVDLITCEGGGHNGCTLAFGHDDLLYISIGDLASPNPPDPRGTGQDISDLYASILRIDVRTTEANKNYAIPKDNPFIDLETARPEVYAFGFRNPFRMSFDAKTGDLWVGDVGWEAWEMVYRVRAGGNYGWAIKEGPGDVLHEQTPGPTPILPADVALGHAEAASVTGGLVYRGQKFPELYGTYIFGDWITRKYWAASFDDERVTGNREIAMGSIKPVCFETDQRGELLILDYSSGKQASGIFTLAPNPALESKITHTFPPRLSETGLFEDVGRHAPSKGVVTYEINEPAWSDGAVSERLLAIPGAGQAEFYQTPQKMFDWFKSTVILPRGSVLAKTLSLPEQEVGSSASAARRAIRRIETQISLKDEAGDWQFYTYRWNEEGTDATLVAAEGDMMQLTAMTPRGPEEFNWSFPSRNSCRICHTPWAGETIGFLESQLRSPERPIDSWRSLLSEGYIAAAGDSPPLPDSLFRGMVCSSDLSKPIDRRARSYLHSNCAHCHLFGGNASTGFDISFEKRLEETKLIDSLPMRGTLDLPDAKIVVPKAPAQSLLLYRIAKAGAGRMPHLGAQTNDPNGIRVVKHWIDQMPIDERLRNAIDRLCAPRLRAADDRQLRLEAAEALLGSVAGAIELSAALTEGRVPPELRRETVSRALEQGGYVADLLEPLADPDQRVARLGQQFDLSEVLGLQGDIARGRLLFVSGTGTCSSCHRLEGVGKEVGPDLSKLHAKYSSREKLLESIVQPSAQIDEAYRQVLLLTFDAETFAGRVLRRDESSVVLQDAQGQQNVILLDDVEAEKLLGASMMPEQLLAPLTAQQAADLLDYIYSQTGKPKGPTTPQTQEGSE